MRWLPARHWLKLFEEMEYSLESMMEDMESSKGREKGTVAFGYSVTRYPDGRTEVKKFGDPEMVKGFEPEEATFQPEGGVVARNYKEPFADVIHDKERGTVTVILEMHGIAEEDIKLSGGDKMLELTAEKGERKYYKQIELEVPVEVEVEVEEPEIACNNGIVEIKLKAREQEA